MTKLQKTASKIIFEAKNERFGSKRASKMIFNDSNYLDKPDIVEMPEMLNCLTLDGLNQCGKGDLRL